MKKIPRDDRRAQHMASDIAVDREELRDHLRGRNHWILATTRRDGRPQMSMVTGGMTDDGEITEEQATCFITNLDSEVIATLVSGDTSSMSDPAVLQDLLGVFETCGIPLG